MEIGFCGCILYISYQENPRKNLSQLTELQNTKSSVTIIEYINSIAIQFMFIVFQAFEHSKIVNEFHEKRIKLILFFKMKETFLFLLCFLRVCIAFASNETMLKSLESVVDMADSAFAKLSADSEIVLVVGGTDRSERTVIRFAGRDIGKLKSKEEENFEYLNEYDTENITRFPEIIVDEGFSWYSFPDFDDSIIQPVAIIFSKQLIEKASNVKVVLVLNYAAIDNDFKNFEEFDNLLVRTIQIIENVDQFENSLALVVTEVPSHFPDEIGTNDNIEHFVKTAIARFAFKYRSILESTGANRSKIQVIDALLKQLTKADYYPRISIFWQPAVSRSPEQIKKISENRQLIRKSILEDIYYAKVEKGDLHFPITVEGKKNIGTLMDNITAAISFSLMNTSKNILSELRRTIETEDDFRIKLKLVDIGKKFIDSIECTDAVGPNGITDMFIDLTNKFSIAPIDVENIDLRVLRFQKYLNGFSDIISNKSNDNQSVLCSTIVEQSLKLFKKFEYETQKNIQIATKQAFSDIFTISQKIESQFLNALHRKINSTLGFREKLKLLEFSKEIEKIGYSLLRPEKKKFSAKLEQWMKRFENLIDEVSITSVDMNAFNQIAKKSKYLEMLNSKTNPIISFPIDQFVIAFSGKFAHQSAHYDYYLFLNETYKFLGSYAVQKDIKRYNVRNVVEWGQSNKAQGLTIGRNNFNDFVKIVSKDIPNNLNKHTGFIPSDPELDDLNDIINITLKTPSTFHEIDTDKKSLTITRDFLLSGDAQNILDQYKEKSDIENLFIYVTDTFYFDPLDLEGLKLVVIVAHTWYILKGDKIGTTTVNLSGRYTYNKMDDISENEAAHNGAHGNDGVYFVGIVRQVAGSNYLEFSGKGGDGGDGQDGKGRPDKFQRKIDDYSNWDYWFWSSPPAEKDFHAIKLKQLFSTVKFRDSTWKSRVGRWQKLIYEYEVFNGDCCGKAYSLGGKGKMRNV